MTDSKADFLATLYGPSRAIEVTEEAREAFQGRELLENYLAIFCNAAGPIQGATDFDRGVEEGKRRVWLEIAALQRLRPSDFPKIATGERFLKDD